MDPDESFSTQTGYAPTALVGSTVAFLVAPEGADQAGTRQMWESVTLTGGHAVLVCPAGGEALLADGGRPGGRMHVDRVLADAGPGDYDALVLPGGAANAEALRANPEALRFALAFFLARKPIAAICEATRLLVQAGLVHDRMLTGAANLRRRRRRRRGVARPAGRDLPRRPERAGHRA
jgi:protease I